MQFSDKVVWITGASSGIGEALALAYSQHGAKLILSARRENELYRVKTSCFAPEHVAVVPMDLEKFNEIPMKAREAQEQFGPIDVVVNNAGISQNSPVKETSLDVDERIMRVDYLAQVAITKAVLPSMLARSSGHFVVVSSRAGLAGIPLHAAYCAAKHALKGFFTSLRAEVRRDGIRITLVYPPTVKTNISVNALCGDGSLYGRMTQRHLEGMPPQLCAAKILAGIEKGSDELFFGFEKTAGHLPPDPASIDASSTGRRV